MLPYLLSIKRHWQDNALAGPSAVDRVPRRTSLGDSPVIKKKKKITVQEGPRICDKKVLFTAAAGRERLVSAAQRWQVDYSRGEYLVLWSRLWRTEVASRCSWVIAADIGPNQKKNAYCLTKFTRVSPSGGYTALINPSSSALTLLINHLNQFWSGLENDEAEQSPPRRCYLNMRYFSRGKNNNHKGMKNF